MNLDSLTRDELLRYLDNEIDLAGLRRWMRTTTWKLGDAHLRAASPMTGRVARYIAEFNLGHRTEDDLRQLFRDAAATVIVDATPSLYEVLLLSAAETIPAAVGPDAVHTKLATAFGQAASLNPRKGHRTTKVPRDRVRTG